MLIKFNHQPLRLGVITAAVAIGGALGIVSTSPAVYAAGVTRYVATTGTDAGDCTSSGSSCATIQYAVNQADAGDSIDVAAGTYSEVVNITKSVALKGAQAGNDARTRSGASETILQTPGGQDKTLRIRAANITVDGFTIDGSTGTNSLGFDFVAPNTNATIVNNVIKNTKVGVDAIYTDISGLTVSKNLFDNNNMTDGSNGVYLANVTGSNIEVSDNTFKDTDNGTVAVAINIQGLSGSPLTDVRVLNNTSTNDGTMIVLIGVHNSEISGNTATNERSTGIVIDQDVVGLQIKNNTLKNSAFGIRFTNSLRPSDPPSADITVSDNTISGMSDAGVRIFTDAISGGVTFAGNTFTGNTVGLDNQGSVAVVANDNYWGCNEGPGNPGCDSVAGNVTLATWVGQTVPGVPNTGFASLVPMVVGAVSFVVLLVSGTYILRRVRN